jgi:SAM-dependent methyltransferase
MTTQLRSSKVGSAIQSGLDSPPSGGQIYDRTIFLSGWIHAPGRNSVSCRVRAYLDDSCIAETGILSYRPDISKKFDLRNKALTGFRMLGKTPTPAVERRESTLRITASWNDQPAHNLIEQPVMIVPVLLDQRPYGEVVYPENAILLHRENIYGSGPPLSDPGIEATQLILGYLPAGSSVVDIGCGAGAYGPALIAAGHKWIGLESDARCCDILRERQLPFRRVDLLAQSLPGETAEWEGGICIEVLEHVKDPESFLSEVARVTRQRVLFSVPNMEVIPYMHGWGVVPWHLLEADHKNFFTRASLRALLERHFRQVEIFLFGEHPLKMREGIPVYVHLFAVADK